MADNSMCNRKRTIRVQTVICKILHRKLKHEPHKNRDELRCSGRVGSSCSISGNTIKKQEKIHLRTGPKSDSKCEETGKTIPVTHLSQDRTLLWLAF